jgi:hypothetical protein
MTGTLQTPCNFFSAHFMNSMSQSNAAFAAGNCKTRRLGVASPFIVCQIKKILITHMHIIEIPKS